MNLFRLRWLLLVRWLRMVGWSLPRRRALRGGSRRCSSSSWQGPARRSPRPPPCWRSSGCTSDAATCTCSADCSARPRLHLAAEYALAALLPAGVLAARGHLLHALVTEAAGRSLLPHPPAQQQNGQRIVAPHRVARLLARMDGCHPQPPHGCAPYRAPAARQRLRPLRGLPGPRPHGPRLHRVLHTQRAPRAAAPARTRRQLAALAQDPHGLAQLLPAHAPRSRTLRGAPSRSSMARRPHGPPSRPSCCFTPYWPNMPPTVPKRAPHPSRERCASATSGSSCRLCCPSPWR